MALVEVRKRFLAEEISEVLDRKSALALIENDLHSRYVSIWWNQVVEADYQTESLPIGIDWQENIEESVYGDYAIGVLKPILHRNGWRELDPISLTQIESVYAEENQERRLVGAFKDVNGRSSSSVLAFWCEDRVVEGQTQPDWFYTTQLVTSPQGLKDQKERFLSVFGGFVDEKIIELQAKNFDGGLYDPVTIIDNTLAAFGYADKNEEWMRRARRDMLPMVLEKFTSLLILPKSFHEKLIEYNDFLGGAKSEIEIVPHVSSLNDGNAMVTWSLITVARSVAPFAIRFIRK